MLKKTLSSLMLILSLATSAQASQKVIYVLGDSLSAGFQLAPNQSLPAQLQMRATAQNLNIKIINVAVSGDTTSDGLARIDWSVRDDADGVIVQLGANDFLRGKAIEETARNLEAIMRRLQERDIQIFIIGMQAPRSMDEEYFTAFDALYPTLARQFETGLYPFYFEGLIGKSELFQADGLHPNAEGVQIVANMMWNSFADWAQRLVDQK